MTTTTPAARPAAEHPTPGHPDRPTPNLLRTALRTDSWSTAAFGVFLLAAGGPLSGPLGLPTTWSIPFGIAMLGGAASLALIAGYPRIPTHLTLTVITANTLSSLALLLLPFTGLLPLTGLGTTFLLIGALVVAAFAALEYGGYRRGERTG
ncbi:hypothetical protein [Streptomyces tubercidicus]|uniref:hypothetical protein n=1 Tax=Streptomyces tubercidicus TaxID=47759 RepID=UPI0037AF98C9